MKTKITFLKLSLLALFLMLSSTVFSKTYYMCSGAILTLSNPVIPGINVLWEVKQGVTTITPASAAVPTSLPTAAGTYTIITSFTQAVPADGICAPDYIENTFVVLPALTFDLGAPSYLSYCEANSSINSSAITPTTLAVPVGSEDDLALEYTYVVTKTDGSVVTGVGSADANGLFTLNTLLPEVYTVNASVKYVEKSGATGELLGLTGCPETAPTPRTITVTKKPDQPTISVSATK